jgi:basic membrane protein A and related proteins
MNCTARRVAVRRVLRVVSALTPILLTSCAPVAAQQSVGPDGMKVCELLQGPPHAGLNRAVQGAVASAPARLGITTEVEAGVAPEVSSFMSDGCGLIVAAGYKASPAVFAFASRYPRQRFLIADHWFDFSSAPDLTRRNVSVLAFEADQASFLAGYVAAAVSPNHVVGEYGSVNIPAVQVALNGFLAGARAWGQDFRHNVRILGWNGSSGRFVGNDFDRRTAFSITSRLIQRGARVIFGAAGDAVLGSAAAAAAHPSVYVIGMYTDYYRAAPRFAGKWLTSVVFDLRSPVLSALRAITRGSFSGGLYVGTVPNGGVRLAPFHRLAHLVPKAVLTRLKVLRTGLAQGWVSTNPADYIPFEMEMGGNA